MAEKAGVAQATIQRILSKNQIPTLDMVEKIAAALELSPPACLILEPAESDLLQSWGKLGPVEKRRVMRFIGMTLDEMQEQGQ